MRQPRGGRALLVVALLAAVYFGYTPALDGELQFDDLRSIAGNVALRDPAHLRQLGASELLGGGRWLTEETFALNYRSGGLAVRGYHLVNVAAHLAAVLAVLSLALLLLRRAAFPAPFAAAWVAAALFGLHPLQSQAVAYVSQRAEVLGALCYLLALRLALLAEEASPAGRTLAYAGALLFVWAGWGAKPTLATYPLALVLCSAAFPAARMTWRRRALDALPFLALTIGFSWRLLHVVAGSTHAGFDIPTLKPGTYLLTQARVVATYLRLLAFPAGQNADWDFPPSRSLLEPRTLFCAILLAALFAAAAWLWRRGALARIAAFGIAWFFLVLAPTSSVVPVLDVIAEHRVYLASFGLFLAAAAAATSTLRRLAPPQRPLAAALAAGALCLSLCAALYRRAAVWESGVALWSDVVAKSPSKARGHMNLGYALTPTDPARAVEEYRRAQELAADGTVRRDELAQDLAGALLGLRRYGEAIAILDDLVARSAPDPRLGTNRAIAYLESGRIEEARAAAGQVASAFPDYAPARHTLGQAAFLRGDYQLARREFAAAAALDPDSAASVASLAAAEEKAGDRAAACRTWARYARMPSAREDAALSRMAGLGCP